MADLPTAEVFCGNCGKRFLASSGSANARIRCTCGAIVKLTSPDPAPENSEYDLAPEAVAQKRATVPIPVALAYRAPKDDLPPKGDPETIINLHMPAWLLAGGIVIEITAAVLKDRNAAAAVIDVGLHVILGTVLMLVGILLAAKFRGISFGSFRVAVFKLAAISIAPAAALTLVSPLLNHIPLGTLIGWAGEFIFYFALIGALFDLDESDTWYCVWVIFLVNIVVYFLLLWAVGSR
jgi:DNA-directed RNA polymerase subunit RPC12/RpoP